MGFENKETAKQAGETSKRGKGVKTEQWEQLGQFVTESGAARAMQILGTLDDEDYLEQYGKLLNYFKPKMTASTIDASVKGDIGVTGDPFREIQKNLDMESDE